MSPSELLETRETGSEEATLGSTDADCHTFLRNKVTVGLEGNQRVSELYPLTDTALKLCDNNLQTSVTISLETRKGYYEEIQSFLAKLLNHCVLTLTLSFSSFSVKTGETVSMQSALSVPQKDSAFGPIIRASCEVE